MYAATIASDHCFQERVIYLNIINAIKGRFVNLATTVV